MKVAFISALLVVALASVVTGTESTSSGNLVSKRMDLIDSFEENASEKALLRTELKDEGASIYTAERMRIRGSGRISRRGRGGRRGGHRGGHHGGHRGGRHGGRRGGHRGGRHGGRHGALKGQSSGVEFILSRPKRRVDQIQHIVFCLSAMHSYALKCLLAYGNLSPQAADTFPFCHGLRISHAAYFERPRVDFTESSVAPEIEDVFLFNIYE
eukprot:IDg22135t1